MSINNGVVLSQILVNLLKYYQCKKNYINKIQLYIYIYEIVFYFNIFENVIYM